jgi:hypothetical protein
MKKFAPKPAARAARSTERPARKSFRADGPPARAPREGYAERKPRADYADRKPRGEFAPRKPRAEFAERAPRAAAGERPTREGYAPRRPPAARGDFSDPYRKVDRPARTFTPRAAAGEGGGFTVTLDPDVARVFRGDASVNKALRLVMQLTEVAAPRPRAGSSVGRSAPAAGEAPRGYRGTSEARGFTRKPRFEEGGDEE